MSSTPPAQKRMLIVGAATGIGAAGARRLAAAGWRLALLDMAADPLARIAAETGATAITVDAGDAAALARGARAGRAVARRTRSGLVERRGPGQWRSR